jgi:uncharacterized protein (TIGR02300 family)
MSKPARGTKRVCPSCGARFYDLGRSPITCPVCQAVYQVNAPSSSRRSERAVPAESTKPEAEEKETPVVAGAEVISLDEAADAEGSSKDDDEEIGDIGDDDDDIPADDDDDDTFLENDEEGDDDVTDIVKGGSEDED